MTLPYPSPALTLTHAQAAAIFDTLYTNGFSVDAILDVLNKSSEYYTASYSDDATNVFLFSDGVMVLRAACGQDVHPGL